MYGNVFSFETEVSREQCLIFCRQTSVHGLNQFSDWVFIWKQSFEWRGEVAARVLILPSGTKAEWFIPLILSFSRNLPLERVSVFSYVSKIVLVCRNNFVFIHSDARCVRDYLTEKLIGNLSHGTRFDISLTPMTNESRVASSRTANIQQLATALIKQFLCSINTLNYI